MSFSNPSSSSNSTTTKKNSSFAKDKIFKPLGKSTDRGNANSSKATATSQKWPQSLQDYVGKAFDSCKNEDQKNKMQSTLTQIIHEAIEAGILHSRRWEYEEIPQIPKSSNDQRIVLTATTTKEDRARRFQAEYERHVESKRAAERIQPLEEDLMMANGHHQDAEAIVGTCEKLEKSYLRLTSAPEPHTVRPLRILRKTLELLREKITGQSVEYGWICDQFKSLRQDLTVQRIKNEFTIEVYEENARIALKNADLGEYNQCQTQLKALYASIGSERATKYGNEDEFLAYRILYFLHTKNLSAMNLQLKELSSRKMHIGPAVNHALQVRQALAVQNYPLLFSSLARNVPNLGASLMRGLVERERIAQCKNICLAFRPNLDLEFCTQLLGFDSVMECKEFLQKNEALFLHSSSEDHLSFPSILDTKASLPVFQAKVEQFKIIDIKGQI